ncbi:YihY/virulence factor BrkB family protein [Gloeothece verrucosa]|uniref:Ribonuclease BN n=1 Tax=Gloeothece verrucosa (strain PCC 7822) TaxID=497965 RepID=E0U591_GLOV7|nr:YihY/virulence factor BrkB family protein [Gloeothece verrucosa]ADN12370.1 ribonuclease BN [Gloeothece verrucosa PCC 7822]
MIQFLRTKIIPSKIVQLLIRTVLKWQQDQCLEMGAALSYYSLFSLFPTLLVILSIFSFFLGPNTEAYNQILHLAKEGLPSEAFQIIEETLIHMNQSSVGAGIVGFSILFFSASQAFDVLSRSINKIWQVPQKYHSKRKIITALLNFIQARIFAFTLVLGTAGIILLSLIFNILTKLLLFLLENVAATVNFIKIDKAFLVAKIQLGTTFFLLLLVVMILFKILPSTKIKWRDIWLGSLLTATSLFFLQQLASNSVIRIGTRFQYYGVIGGVMVLLLWIYLTCEIFFLGSEFTFIYAQLFGSRRSE